MVSAILLAAGSSTRMGEQDKLLLKYKGHWLVNHVMQQLWASKVDELIIVRKNKADNLLGGLSSDRIKVVVNPKADLGMTTSIQAGVKAANINSKGFMICQADMPLVQSSEYNLIIDAFKKRRAENEQCIAAPFFNHQKGNPIIFSSFYKSAILNHAEMEGCRRIVKENISQVLKVEMAKDHVLIDVDTKTDWEALLQR